MWWAAAATTAASALISAAFASTGLVSVLRTDDGTAKAFAMYAAARSLPLAGVVVWLVLERSTRRLATVALVTGLVQAGDALVGMAVHDPAKTIGPAVLALATLAGIPSLRRGRAATRTKQSAQA